MNKEKIIAKNKEHLQELIKKEIDLNGNNCNLNHIDTSLITDMSFLFEKNDFNGNISQWDVSNVKNMCCMFNHSKFNGDISQWGVHNLEYMTTMFSSSQFNGDISKWDVSNVQDMTYLFSSSVFCGDISQYNCVRVKSVAYIFKNCSAPVPYWAKIDSFEDRVAAINAYHNKKLLERLIEKNGMNNSLVRNILKI